MQCKQNALAAEAVKNLQGFKNEKEFEIIAEPGSPIINSKRTPEASYPLVNEDSISMGGVGFQDVDAQPEGLETALDFVPHAQPEVITLRSSNHQIEGEQRDDVIFSE